MAIKIIDDFNSYTDGNLNGQGGWSGDTSYQVQGTTVYEGAKAIANASGTNDVSIVKNITSQTAGIFSIYMRREWTGLYNIKFYIKQGSTKKAYLYFNTESGGVSSIRVEGGSTANMTTASISTFYKFDIEIDQVNSRVRGRMNDGTWTSWVSCSFSYIDYISLEKASNGNTANAYYDYITFDDGVTGTSKFFQLF